MGGMLEGASSRMSSGILMVISTGGFGVVIDGSMVAFDPLITGGESFGVVINGSMMAIDPLITACN